MLRVITYFEIPWLRLPLAIRSKKTQSVTMSPQLLEQFQKPLLREFSFNRLPVHATIELPHLGLTDCYVVHFKSQRPIEAEKPEKRCAALSCITDS